MKALTVRQPWATLIATGRKTIELRSRPIKHRGPLLICAAKRADKDGIPIALSVVGELPAQMPLGVALCIVDVIDCRPMNPQDRNAACSPYQPDTFAWVLGNVRPVKPFPVSGQQSLFNVELPVAS